MKTLPFCHIYAQLDQTRDRIDAELDHLFGLGFTCDTSISFAQAGNHRDVLHKLIQRGGLVAPNIYPQELDESCRDANWWKYSREDCVRLLREAASRFEAFELGPMSAVNTYTPGNSFVAACRETGVRYILGFCAPTVIEDGGWEIAHYGSPLSPYFVSSEDYRKPENPGERSDAVLVSSMELRNPMVCLNHWSEGPWCPLNAQAVDRWLEPTADPFPFLQAAEDWLKESELSSRPLFFHINLQYFFAGRCYEHNRRALEWLAEQRDKGRLAVGGLREWAQTMKQNAGFKKQVSYWRGEMMGLHVGHRPGCFPDVIVDEDLDRQYIWQSPDPLPVRFYDYQKKWDYPAFEPNGTAPASTAFSGISITIEPGNSGDMERAVSIENKALPQRASLALWDFLEGWKEPWEIAVDSQDWSVRVVPHPSGAGGTVLLEGTIPSGKCRLTVRVKAIQCSAQIHSRQWGNLVAAQTFYHQNRPYTVLAAQTPEPFIVEAKIQGNPHQQEPVTVESLCGIDYAHFAIENHRCVLRFDASRLASWHRIWGVTADQIDLTGIGEIEARLKRKTAELVEKRCPGLTIPEPGYQLFGNIRTPSRWDRRLAHAAGEAERCAMNEWLRQQRPGIGEVLIEAHPGIYLPRGSISKVLGHEFDMIHCAKGYQFKELCADYPQGWDWGVAAWVQWRHLQVRIDGLSPAGGTYLLHLHAFDPEERDIVQRVHFFNPDAGHGAAQFEAFPVHAPSELCAVKEWVLPKGIEGRWSPSSLCSIVIPEECRAWPSLGVWISPVEKMKLYDWVNEHGASGLISHVWLSHHPQP